MPKYSMLKKLKKIKKRYYLLAAAGVLLIIIIIVSAVRPKAVYDFSAAFALYTENNADADAHNAAPVTAAPGDMKLSAGAALLQGTESMGYGGPAVKLTEGESLSFEANVMQAGAYYLYFDYYLFNRGTEETNITVTLNGELPGDEYRLVPLDSYWANESDEAAKDRYGNDVLPMQSQKLMWSGVYAEHYLYTSDTPLIFLLDQGKNDIKIVLNQGEALLGSFTFEAKKRIVGYDEYAALYKSTGPGRGYKTIEAENPAYKNNISIVASNERDMDATPYDTYHFRLNAIGSEDSFYKAGEAVYYEFEAAETGLYRIVLNYKQTESNKTSFFKILIDGRLFFGELLHYPLRNTDNYTSETLGKHGKDFLFYLEKGAHVISFVNDGAAAARVTGDIDALIKDFNKFYLDILKMTGANPDADRDWEINEYYPGAEEFFNSRIKRLEGDIALFKKINGTDSANQVTTYLNSALRLLNKLIKNPNRIPNNIRWLSEGSSSVIQSLSAAIDYLAYQPVYLDKFAVVAESETLKFKASNGFSKFWARVKLFFYSFGAAYSQTKDADTIEVWINRTGMAMNFMQEMTDSQFTPKTGIKVNFSVLKDEGRIILANASGTVPDGAIGISNWLPYELGIRGLCYDLRKYSDYNEVIRRFSSGALIPLAVDGKGLALPETQDFFVLFYRKDILDALGLDVPDTWTDVIEMMPALQRNGMNFYLPLSVSGNKALGTTAPFIIQNGGSLYAPDGSKTAIDSEESLSGIKLMTDLYTKYGLSTTVSSFLEHFRSGSIPIGVAPFDMYLKVKLSARELDGLWEIAPAPGIKNEDGVTERWQSGSATCAVAFDRGKADKMWEFMKWWTSTETQVNYAQQIMGVWGEEYLWNSANTEAFANGPMPTEHKAVILKQWEWLTEFPRVPGWYMIERELSNAWNNIVLDGKNVRATVDNSISIINKEMARKLTEFGYMKGGVMVKEYKITTIEEIERWKAS